jgi:hypothetical protein
MSLNEYKVVAGLAVSDMDRAREFYEGKLGLSVGIDSSDNVAYRCAEESVLHVYLSPEHAGKSRATLASWYVDDVEGVVDELTRKGRSSRTRRASPRSSETPRSPISRTRTATPSRSLKRRVPECAQTPSVFSEVRYR